MTFHHVHVEYERTADAQARYLTARSTWLETYEKCQWKELQAHDKSLPRNSSVMLGDTRSLPFVRDVIDFASKHIENPSDYIVLTNDDTCFYESLAGQLYSSAMIGLPSFAHRWDYQGDSSESTWYCGTDLFAFTKKWWLANRSSFPDFVLGCEHWDCILRLLIKRSGGVELNKAIYHEWHNPIWFHDTFRRDNPGQRYNTQLAHEWFARDAVPKQHESLQEYERYAKAYWSGISDHCERAITPGNQWEGAIGDVDILIHGLDPDWRYEHSVIEFGCGEGRLATELASKFKSYRGVDLSQSCIDRCGQLVIPNADFRLINGVSDITDLQDCIVSWTVFMHMPHRVFHQTLQRLSGLLNPDGYLCFQLSFPDRFDHLRYDVVPDSNLWNSRWYPDSVASKIITDCGLTILRSQGLGHGAWLTQKAT